MNQSLFDIKDLTYTRDKRQVLSIANFEIHRGITYAITGQSGTGKSTLLDVLAGVRKPDSGVIKYDGELINTSAAKKKFKNDIFYLPQEAWRARGVARRYMLKYIATAEWSNETAEGRLDKVARQLNVTEKLTRKIQTLSPGERRLIDLAICLASDSKILIIDEIEQHLSYDEIESVKRLLQRKCNFEGTTIILGTLSPGTIKKMTGVSVTIDRGRIAMIRSVREGGRSRSPEDRGRGRDNDRQRDGRQRRDGRGRNQGGNGPKGGGGESRKKSEDSSRKPNGQKEQEGGADKGKRPSRRPRRSSRPDAAAPADSVTSTDAPTKTNEGSETSAPAAESPKSNKPTRGRGRSRKPIADSPSAPVDNEQMSIAASTTPEESKPEKSDAPTASTEETPTAKPARRPGRPRKDSKAKTTVRGNAKPKKAAEKSEPKEIDGNTLEGHSRTTTSEELKKSAGRVGRGRGTSRSGPARRRTPKKTD